MLACRIPGVLDRARIRRLAVPGEFSAGQCRRSLDHVGVRQVGRRGGPRVGSLCRLSRRRPSLFPRPAGAPLLSGNVFQSVWRRRGTGTNSVARCRGRPALCRRVARLQVGRPPLLPGRGNPPAVLALSPDRPRRPPASAGPRAIGSLRRHRNELLVVDDLHVRAAPRHTAPDDGDHVRTAGRSYRTDAVLRRRRAHGLRGDAALDKATREA